MEEKVRSKTLNGQTMNNFYAGIGSRETPAHILYEMTVIGKVLAQKNWALRSGGANGADVAFEQGCDFENGEKEIFLPWKGFNHHLSLLHTPSVSAYEIAEKYHPRFKYLPPYAKALHARNTHQVLGSIIPHDPISKFVVCWTKDGCEDGTKTTKETGGTGQALRIATAYNVPIFNLKNDDSLKKLIAFIR